MTAFGDLTWQEAMRQGHEALMESESLYADINTSEGRSNLDISRSTCDERRYEPPRPRSGSPWPVSWAARASGTATQGPRTRWGRWLARHRDRHDQPLTRTCERPQEVMI